MRRAWLLVLLLAGLAGSISCRSEPDAKEALKVTDVVTGWLDKGIVGGQNKLVPTISLKIKNGANRRCPTCSSTPCSASSATPRSSARR